MTWFRGPIAPLVVLVLGLWACESGPSPTHTAAGARMSPAAAAVDPQRCARLARRGFTPCPPTPDRMQLPATTIRNATNGAVSDATAQQWGRAFQLAQAYYYWAMENNARSALTSGVLADSSPQAVGNLFGNDLMDLDNARQAGGVLVYVPPRTPTTQAVAIPSDLEAAIRRQGLTAKAFGIAVRIAGPTSRGVRLPDGTTKPLSSGDTSYIADVVTWGELRTDPDLGAVWYEFGYYGCEGRVRSVCQL